MPELAAAALGAALRRSLQQAAPPLQRTGVFISGSAVECAVNEACTGYRVQVMPPGHAIWHVALL